MRAYPKTVTLTIAATAVALLLGPAVASEGRSCDGVYEGKTSSVASCDNNSIRWTLPKDALRIDKPFKPGPGAIVREVPDKLIRKPAAWIGKRLGIKW